MIGKMITNILEKQRKKIELNAIAINENDRIYVRMNKTEIKGRVKNHYENWTCNREINLEIIGNNEQ
jgi:hypothetical protein